MRVAIATNGDRVAQHFGRCPVYTILDIENDQIIQRTAIPAPEHRPHFYPRFLSEKGVERVVAGGMGRNARDLFERFNIETIIGVDAEIETVVDLLLRDELKGGDNGCDSHEHREHHEHHEHQHHHHSRG